MWYLILGGRGGVWYLTLGGRGGVCVVSYPRG